MSTNQQRREAAKRKLERQQERRSQREQRRKRMSAIVAALVVIAVVGTGVAFAFLDSGSDKPADDLAANEAAKQVPLPNLAIPTQVAPEPARPTALPATVSCSYPAEPPAAKSANPPPTEGISARGKVPVSLGSTVGQIELQLDRALAPCTVNSFVSLSQQGYFNGTSCHRLTTSPGLQVLQCGDPTGKGSGGPGYSFADETFPALTYGRGLVAMANSGPNTNGSQFFMIYGTAQLPPNYTVFGTISPATLALLDGVARAGYDDPGEAGEGDGNPHQKVTFSTAKIG